MTQKSQQEIAKEKKAAVAQAAKDKAAAAQETENKRVAAVAQAAQVPEAERTAEQIALLKEDEEIKANQLSENIADDKPEINKKGSLPKELAFKTASDGKSQQIV